MNREELLKNAKPILFNTEMVQAISEGRKTVTRRNPFNFEMKEGYNPEWSGYSLGEYFTGHIDSGVCLYSRGIHDVWGVRSKVVKPKYKVGDILYVRETWKIQSMKRFDNKVKFIFKAWGEYVIHEATVSHDKYIDLLKYECKTGWQPSLFMPKEAARIFLKVTDVRIERVKNITWEQTLAEGIEHDNVNKQEDILCEYCPIEESQRGVKNYGNGPSFCIDSGMCEKAKLNFEDDCVDCFSELWDSTIKKQDLDKYGWDANPWVWVIDFERAEVENE